MRVMKVIFLSPDEVRGFEQQYGQYGRRIHAAEEADRAAGSAAHAAPGYGLAEEGNKLSIRPLISGAPALIELIPQFLTWNDAEAFLDMITALDYEASQLRLRQALNEIEKMDSGIAVGMRDALEKLPPWAAVRFTIAPATRQRLALLRKAPATHVASLCRTLKAELRLSGEEVSGEGCWTALGDFFLTGEAGDFVDPRVSGWSPDANLRAPRLMQIIPVDAASPNLHDISSPTSSFELHTPEEFAATARKLRAVMEFAGSVPGSAGRVIQRCVKVIVAGKTNGVIGSSSHYTFPGQVLLRTSSRSTEAMIASALVHETIHQVLYVLESGERFVDERALGGGVMVASPWTERQLAVHSYIHACFVWYGLATFWRRVLASRSLQAEAMEAQFNEALRGFRGGNPVDRLLPYRDAICPEAMQAVACLRDELMRAGGLEGQPAVVRGVQPTGTVGLAPVANALH